MRAREYSPAQRRIIDARLTESLGQVKRGETHGPFETHEEMIAFLNAKATKAPPKKITPPKSRF
jgi:hypothetical protein